MKVFGLKNEYAPVRTEGTRTVVSYKKEDIDNKYATWEEVYLYHKQHSMITASVIKQSIIADINAKTDEKIISGFVWENIHVWLSSENQRNFSEAQRMAAADDSILPITFKLGEQEDGTPVYHTFTSSSELDSFYASAFAYINQCLQEGWQLKDSIDFSVYGEDEEEPEEEIS